MILNVGLSGGRDDEEVCIFWAQFLNCGKCSTEAQWIQINQEDP